MKKFKNTLLALAISSCSLSVLADPVELDRVLTVVNEGVILSSDVEALKKTVLLNATSRLPDEKTLQKQILEQLIIEELQLQEAERLSIKIDDSKLDTAINRIAQEKKMSITSLRTELSNRGISWADYREQLRKELTINEVRNAHVRRRINILPQEVSSLAKQLEQQNQQQIQYNISQIQLSLPEDADKAQRDRTKQKAEKLITEIKQGKNFTELAMANSNGPRALNGGKWGWMRIEEMPTIFADKIGNNTKGAIIGPFRSGVGFHILKINDTKGLESVAVTEINARHILIKPSIILSDEKAEKQLVKMLQQINAGQKTFADLAKQFSADPGSAAKGGELGWQTSEVYVPEFKERIDHLPIGKISEPFKTAHGWHIVEVLDRRESDRTDAAMKNRAYSLILNRKFNEETQAWLQELRAGAYVEQVGNLNNND